MQENKNSGRQQRDSPENRRTGENEKRDSRKRPSNADQKEEKAAKSRRNSDSSDFDQNELDKMFEVNININNTKSHIQHNQHMIT